MERIISNNRQFQPALPVNMITNSPLPLSSVMSSSPISIPSHSMSSKNSDQIKSGVCKTPKKRKICQINLCKRNARSGGDYCIKHGGGPRCLAENCDHGARDKTGYCIRHGGGQRCAVNGCTKGAAVRRDGLCTKHYREIYEKGRKVSHDINPRVYNDAGEEIPSKKQRLSDSPNVNLAGTDLLNETLVQTFHIEKELMDQRAILTNHLLSITKLNEQLSALSHRRMYMDGIRTTLPVPFATHGPINAIPDLTNLAIMSTPQPMKTTLIPGPQMIKPHLTHLIQTSAAVSPLTCSPIHPAELMKSIMHERYMNHVGMKIEQ